MKQKWIFLFVILLIASQACASSSSSTPVISSADVTLTVFSLNSIGETSSFLKLSAGNVLVVCNVTLGPSAGNKTPYNPLDFKVKDSYGIERGASAACLTRH